MKDSMVGARLARLEDPALLKGKGKYVGDITLPGMLEASFVRSPHPHAMIRSIDARAAREHPGVHAVLTHDDFQSVLATNYIPSDHKSWQFPETSKPVVIPKEEVCFAGEAVAMVLAESRYIAEDATALVDVDYEPLPAVSDCRDALATGAPTVHAAAADNIVTEFYTEYGDCTAAFANAAHTFRISLKQHRGGAHSIEARGVVAHYEPHTDVLTVWASTQTAHKIRNGLVELLGTDEHRVRVIVPDVGGAFGGKNLLYPEDAMACVASRILERPVRWIEDRREHFLAAIQERDQYWDIGIATDDDGRILGIEGTILHDQGAYTLLHLHVPHNSAIAVPGPYVVPNYRVFTRVIETNRVGTIPVRGAGYPEGNFAMERLLDEVARNLGLDRAEVRRRNLIPSQGMPYELPMQTRERTPIIYDSGDFPGCQARAVEAIDYDEFAERQARARAEGRYIGIGIANMIKVTGRGPFESGLVRVGRSGRVMEVASHMLEASSQDLELEAGEVRVKGAPGLSVSLGDIAKALSGVKGYDKPGGLKPSLESTVDYMPPDVTYGNACHAVEVEVDIGTGDVELLRYVVVNDSGRLINPMIVEGQIQGGVAHGIGNALFEWMGYDENAQPVITTFADYLLPSSTEVPNIEIIHHEFPSTLNPLGVKGVGEAGTIPAAAVIVSAVENALAPFAVRIGEAPISPVRIVELIDAAGAAASD